jgi:hypothetical protein
VWVVGMLRPWAWQAGGGGERRDHELEGEIVEGVGQFGGRSWGIPLRGHLGVSGCS